MAEQTKDIRLEIAMEHEKNIVGQLDAYLKKLERVFSVTMVSRDGVMHILGEGSGPEEAEKVLKELVSLSERGHDITEQEVNYLCTMAKSSSGTSLAELDEDCICHTVHGRPVKPKTHGQKQYVDAIRDHMITFGLGPAGTGKTYLAMAMAINAFRNEEVDRIILTRPAIEAGEKLGFLPGDLQNKVDPYLRPLYDALFDMLGAETYQRYLERGNIEIAPLAFMRGRTLDDSFIILDEAQNTTSEQMKMFLTRLGFNSRIVVTGDVTQTDLPDGKTSGLKEALRVLRGVEGIGISELTDKDIVRHELVGRILRAYESQDKRKQV